jgi:DNA-binding response OmpR family regulator
MEKMKKTVLLVDDEEEMTRLLKIELEQEGYEIFVAHDGLEGFQRIRECSPDVIILDIMMPGMDGYEMLKILKADDATKDIPVVILTAKTQEVDIQKGNALGATLYITKPFDSDELISRINAVIEEG